MRINQPAPFSGFLIAPQTFGDCLTNTSKAESCPAKIDKTKTTGEALCNVDTTVAVSECEADFWGCQKKFEACERTVDEMQPSFFSQPPIVAVLSVVGTLLIVWVNREIKK